MARHRRIRWDKRDEKTRRIARPAVVQPAHDLTRPGGASVQRYGLPAHSTARPLRQAAVLQMQQRYGNAAVQCYLASLDSTTDHQVAQRQLKPEKTKAEAAIGTKELKLKADLSLSSDGSLKLNVGPALDLGLFGLSATASIDPKGWKGVGRLRLGDKKNYLAPEVVVGAGGELTFNLGHKFTKDMFTLSSKLSIGKEKTTLSHTLGLENVFGAEGFNVKASLNYRADDPRFTGAKVSGEYKFLGGGKGKSTPRLMLIFEGSYQAGGPGKADEAKGMVLLRLGG